MLTGGRLQGRVSVVTGASRGIGAAIARAFVAEGSAVALVHFEDRESAHDLRDELHAAGATVRVIEGDVSVERDVHRVLDEAEQLGSVEILVNCAGIGGRSEFGDMTIEHWSRILAVNLTGSFLMARGCYPAMKRRGSGRIINVASQMAFSGAPGAVAYGASKAGVIGLTRSLALEAAPFGVLVNAIAPGATSTDMLRANGPDVLESIRSRIPLARFGSPDEIAPTAVLLASDDGAFFVGQTLSPNGGDVLR